MLSQFKYAENPETRRTAYEKFENRLSVNKPVMAKFLGLRRQIAKLLDYPTWADYVTEVKMVKDATSVKSVRSPHGHGFSGTHSSLFLVPRRPRAEAPSCRHQGSRYPACAQEGRTQAEGPTFRRRVLSLGLPVLRPQVYRTNLEARRLSRQGVLPRVQGRTCYP